MDLSPPSESRQDLESLKSTAFVVHFETPNGARRPTHNKRMRHMRNLSLPITGFYNSQTNESISAPGGAPRCAGYHSEGYFSSDQEDDSARSRLQSVRRPSLGNGETCALSPMAENVPGIGDKNNNGDDESDTLSDTGTYTIDKETTEVKHARNAISKVFGLHEDCKDENNIPGNHHENSWVSEWASRLVSNQRDPAPSPTTECRPICSPKSPQRLNHLSKSDQPQFEEDDSALETASFLRTTESVVSAMTARMSNSLSLDSGDESSDISDPLGPTIKKRLAPATTEIASIQTRHNRAFSLRRARLGCDAPGEDRKKGAVLATEPVQVSMTPPAPAPALVPTSASKQCRKGSVDSSRSSSNSSPKTASPKTASPKVASPRPVRAEPFARTDCGRFSMRTTKSATPVLPAVKKDAGQPKTGKKLVGVGSSTRSNSTLSSREVEFQNWKRRKSYDPMKAAAEGKKKEQPAKKSTLHTPATSSSGATSAIPTAVPLPSPTTSPTNHVLRSASFHGHGHGHGLLPPYNDFDSEEDDDEDYSQSPPGLATLPSPVQSTPPMQQTMDSLVIVALSGISQKLKCSSSNLLKKLRYLYESDSIAAERLDMQIHLLEEVDRTTPTSPLRSPSRELSSTLRNLKRLESALQVLDDVLFEDEEELVLH
ncbi:Centrosomal protein of 170 kDa protein B [Frankliniella fusca]|uniref:Centrosomal protein of 170 kDa protein B n=1 Tax=Frankliniella fusca TaxID=407009 RepID=A0AAE1LU53_9NEOP|nr:Centrosomal protein of 170 kDa protein B [Frankliniella fusca]